ncbi:MAG: sodium:calcium antiporter, partial [Dehalococcoidia bacterium]|nr:sodium:calcium antiporter [Dehalococcoidia bacterium]
LDGRIGQLEGLVLFLLLIAYTWFMIWQSRRSQNAELSAEYAQEYALKEKAGPLQWLLNIGFVIGGLVVLVIGSRMLVDAAVGLALAFGVSELVIGMTIVAAGTSLPEVAASVVAAIRGERDIAVGNVVGSNLFNIFMVLGLSALASPVGITVSPAALAFDIPVMVAVAVASLPIFFSGYLITRWEGAVFLAYYVIYTVYLILTAQEHAALQGFTTIMTFFVLPITLLTLIIITVRSLRANSKPPTARESAG